MEIGRFGRQLWSVLGYASTTSWVIVTLSSGLSGIAAFMQGFPPILIVLVMVAFFVVVAALLVLRDWQKRIRVNGFEISGPECLPDNRNPERREVQLCRVRIKNIAGKPLRNCQVRMASMKDNSGKESREVGRHLWLSKQRGNLDPLGKHPTQQKRFDLSVDAEEWLDVLYLDPVDPTKIRVCYARNEEDKGVFINFGGVASHTPYTFVVSATSDDCREERMSFRYWVDDEGALLVKGLGNGPARTDESKRAAVL